MSNKILSPKEWKKFGAGRSLSDSGLLRALTRLEFFADDTAQRILASAETGRQLAALQKTHRGGADVARYLDQMDKALAGLRQELQEKADAQQARAILVEPLSRTEVEARLASMRRGGEMQVLVACLGQRAVVLLSRRDILGKNRAVLQEYLGAGKPRFHEGSCSFRNPYYTLRLDAPSAGLAKQVRTALFEQAGVWLKIRVQDAVSSRSEAVSSDDDDDSGVGGPGGSSTSGTPDSFGPTGDSVDSGLGSDPASPRATAAMPVPPSPLRARSSEAVALTTLLSGLTAEIQQVLASGQGAAPTVQTLVREMAEQVARNDFVQARQTVAALEQALRSPPAAAPGPAPAAIADPATSAEAEAQRQAMLAEFEPLRQHCNSLLALSAEDPEWFRAGRKPAKALLDQLILGLVGGVGAAADMRHALDALRQMVPALTELGAKRDALGEFRRLGLPAAHKTLALPTDGHEGMRRAQAALARLLAVIDPPISLAAATLAEVERLIGAVQAARDVVLQESAGRFLQLRGDAGPAVTRARMVAAGDALQQMAEVTEGRDLLDLLVADIGKAAHGQTDNTFVKRALDARFQATFTGDLDGAAGVRLYGVFSLVPESHTRLNPRIREIQRNRNSGVSSLYDSKANEEAGLGPGHIVVNGVRSGGLLGWASDAITNAWSTHRYRHVENGRKINVFDAVTLHEIGHGVDEKLNYMDIHGHEPRFGGWMNHSVQEVANAVGVETGFFKAFRDQPQSMLQAYLKDALGKDFDAGKFKRKSRAAAGLTDQDLRQDLGVMLAVAGTAERAWREHDKEFLAARMRDATGAIGLTGAAVALVKEAIGAILAGMPLDDAIGQVLGLATDPEPDWYAVSQHTAVHLCLGIRQKGAAGLWDRGEGARQYALSGRIYQQSYANSWCSYLESARAIRVSNYQFRAPGEWFAECYSAFYQQKLPASHPLHAFLAAQA